MFGAGSAIANSRGFLSLAGVHGLATVTSKTNQERLITNSWRLIAVVANSRRLMGGLHYSTLTAGFNRFEFAAEALLNLAKSLQSTFGESWDEVRAELEKLQILKPRLKRS